MASFRVKCSDQQLGKSKAGDPQLILTVDVLGRYVNAFDESYGIETDIPEKKAKIFLSFAGQYLSGTMETLAVLGIKGATLASFHPSNKNGISLVGKEFMAYTGKPREDGKVFWNISKTKPQKAGESAFSLEEAKQFDSENAEMYQAAAEDIPF